MQCGFTDRRKLDLLTDQTDKEEGNKGMGVETILTSPCHLIFFPNKATNIDPRKYYGV